MGKYYNTAGDIAVATEKIKIVCANRVIFHRLMTAKRFVFFQDSRIRVKVPIQVTVHCLFCKIEIADSSKTLGGSIEKAL